ncbi:autotransporter outer membrane beta-barrel domain-containing protein [Bythopirellula goksoeyrii]|uniref:Uncharacterized protein n=1 Tax=Bythopirellula goksoeyrii TaxID=1400387 RepID=A0A5B9QEP1_9BACT|nr:hypothetical protein [Bythopirellula goksoeyrii]QEG36349.1 hypothetical protein Pr1d_36630 [Bythopirellula goksoeyrii]
MKRLLGSATTLTAILVVLVICPSVLGQTFDFVVVATTDSQIPGAPAGTTFSNIPRPAIRGGNVVFRGEGPGTEGIYALRQGALEVLADKNTPVPGDPGASNFIDFIESPTLDTSFNVAFKGQGASGVKGIYAVVDGELTMIADTNTKIPISNPAANFTDFSVPWIDNGKVVFRGTGPGGIDGIYTNLNGSLLRVASTSAGSLNGTSIPDGVGDFTGFGKFSSGPAQAPSIGGDSIAFYGEGTGGQQGIYAKIGGINAPIVRIANTNTAIPGGGGATFPGFDVNGALGAATYDDGVVFVAGLESDPFPNRLGIYKWWSGSLMTIADTNTVVVGEGGNLTSFGEGQGLSFYKDEYSFLGDGSSIGGGNPSPQGIYAILGGQLVKVLTNDDLLEGESVGGMGSYGQGIEDGSIVFNIGSWGNTTANVVAIQEHRWLGAGSVVYGEPGSGADWEDKANWPFGGIPRAVVPTIIAPEGAATIHGPVADTQLASLELGSGNGVATLWLNNGALITTPSTTIESKGVLAGDGRISGPVTNHGVIRPDDISTGAIQNHGLIDVATEASRLSAGSSAITNNGIIHGDGTLSTSGELTNNGDIDVAYLTINNQITNNGLLNAARVTVGGCIFNNNGAELMLVGDGAVMSGDELQNSGVLRGSGRIEVSVFENNSDGEVRVGPGDQLQIGGATFSNSGRIEAIGTTVSPAEIEFDAAVTNEEADGEIFARNTLLRFNGGLENQASLSLSFGTSDVFGDIFNVDTGTIIISGNSDATFYDDMINDGELRTSAGTVAVFFGDVSGSGSYTGTGTVFLEGMFSPGNSPAAVSFGGDLHFGGLASLEVELGGTTAGTEHDHVSVANVASLAGTLDVSLINGFMPTAGDTFEILTAASILGTLTPGALPSLPGNLQWFVNHTNTSVALVTTFAGDFDFDGDVDGRDFIVWQRNPSVGNLTDWQTNYGEFVALSASSTVVPEPTTWVLLLTALVVKLARRLRIAE